MKMNLRDYQIIEFTFEGREAKLICPVNPVGRLVLKMEYWDAFPDVEAMLVDRGYHLAYLKNTSRFAPREDCDAKARFIRFLASEYNLSCKCVPVGMSLGGAHAILFAGLYPELTACIYLDAPVVNYCCLHSCRIGSDTPVWEREVQAIYPGLKHYQLASFPGNPVLMIDTLVENRIPVVMCYGGQDASVEYRDHGALLEEAYEGTDLMKVFFVSLRGHHPHGLLEDNSPIVDYIRNCGNY